MIERAIGKSGVQLIADGLGGNLMAGAKPVPRRLLGKKSSKPHLGSSHWKVCEHFLLEQRRGIERFGGEWKVMSVHQVEPFAGGQVENGADDPVAAVHVEIDNIVGGQDDHGIINDSIGIREIAMDAAI